MENERRVDLESLKALAHPLRVQIIDALAAYGAQTASGLADRLGESSGATSYHLRQLEKHQFVREVEGKGTGRERWWERTPGGFTIGYEHLNESPAARSASRLVMREWVNRREATVRDFVDRGHAELSPEWMDASVLGMSSIPLTVTQLAELSAAIMQVVDDFADKYRDQDVPGVRPTQVQFASFPLIDGVESAASDHTKAQS
jgi:DNA-binding transcriptional ArsR family regulator